MYKEARSSFASFLTLRIVSFPQIPVRRTRKALRLPSPGGSSEFWPTQNLFKGATSDACQGSTIFAARKRAKLALDTRKRQHALKCFRQLLLTEDALRRAILKNFCSTSRLGFRENAEGGGGRFAPAPGASCEGRQSRTRKGVWGNVSFIQLTFSPSTHNAHDQGHPLKPQHL